MRSWCRVRWARRPASTELTAEIEEHSGKLSDLLALEACTTGLTAEIEEHSGNFGNLLAKEAPHVKMCGLRGPPSVAHHRGDEAGAAAGTGATTPVREARPTAAAALAKCFFVFGEEQPLARPN